MRTWLLILLAGIALVGCSGPMDTKIDASTPEAYQKSLQSIKSRLSPEDTRRFEEALMVVAFSDLVPKDAGLIGMLAAMGNPEKLQGQMLATVNGKTPRQIIDEAAQKKRARSEGELKSVTEEMATLEKRKVEAAKSVGVLGKIVVTEPRYYWSKASFMPQPVIDFKVTNQTAQALSRIYYHGTVTSPGRSIPWIDEDFNNELAGGLEPGETKHLQLSPNMFSNWGTRETQGRDDLVLTVRVVNAEGAEKKELAAQFEKDDAQRLETLRGMKVELEKTLVAK